MLTKLDLLQIKKIVQGEIHIELAPIRKDIKKLQKSIDEMLDVLDKEDVRLRKRVAENFRAGLLLAGILEFQKG